MANYDSLSDADLDSLVRELRDLQAKRKGNLTRESLLEKLSPNSSDFLGTGMSLQEFHMAGEIERIKRSFPKQTREEQNRRLDLVIRMSVEYNDVRQTTNQSGSFARAAIEHVFSGDVRGLQSCLELLSFENEDDWAKPYIAAYSKFRFLIQEALKGFQPPTQELPSKDLS